MERHRPKQYEPVRHGAVFRKPGEHVARLAVETSVAATLVSDDVTQNSLLQGYRKQYLSAATLPFSVVEDVARVVLRIDAPRTVRVGQSFQLVGVIEESQVDRASLSGSPGAASRAVSAYSMATPRQRAGRNRPREGTSTSPRRS